ncbi:DnaJ domain-containing protein [Streptomyces spiramyceticus]|uniref:DnaJ domain-containing protein n=1 Tax=Streptomyces spiramyceticus TaxID=299717 RepID=UPI00237A7D63|nr:DnaJ domain-containing protein [Streptomyces spiramyceticus]
MNSSPLDLYAVLGVAPDAPAFTIRRAYRQQLLRIHPDRRPASKQAAAHEEMTRLNLAFDTLSDEAKRRAYDLDERARRRAAGRTTADPPPKPPPPPEPPRPPPAPKPSPQPEPSSAAPKPSSSTGWRVLVGAVLLAVCLAFGSVHLLGLSFPDSDRSEPYCFESSSDGQSISYFRAKPGSRTETSEVIWSVADLSEDDYVVWRTPKFPYWERANAEPGLLREGWTYGRYEYVEVLVEKQAGWEPLEGLFERRPQLDNVAEREQRWAFLTDWIGHLDAPWCG